MPPSKSNISTPILWCTRCHTAHAFCGDSIERLPTNKLVVRYRECGALNGITVRSETEEGHDLYSAVVEIQTTH